MSVLYLSYQPSTPRGSTALRLVLVNPLFKLWLNPTHLAFAMYSSRQRMPLSISDPYSDRFKIWLVFRASTCPFRLDPLSHVLFLSMTCCIVVGVARSSCLSSLGPSCARVPCWCFVKLPRLSTRELRIDLPIMTSTKSLSITFTGFPCH
jgi:hypothetical protein